MVDFGWKYVGIKNHVYEIILMKNENLYKNDLMHTFCIILIIWISDAFLCFFTIKIMMFNWFYYNKTSNSFNSDFAA